MNLNKNACNCSEATYRCQLKNSHILVTLTQHRVLLYEQAHKKTYRVLWMSQKTNIISLVPCSENGEICLTTSTDISTQKIKYVCLKTEAVSNSFAYIIFLYIKNMKILVYYVFIVLV